MRETADDRPAWELWRQDDNGNRFLIAQFATAEAAEAEQRRFEALGHKQTYWVSPPRTPRATADLYGPGPVRVSHRSTGANCHPRV